MDYRFQKYEWNIITPNMQEKEKIFKWLISKANKYQVNIAACCVSGLEQSRCIDGMLLEDLHDSNKKTDLVEPKKRKLCKCTNSIDVGGWPPQKCYSGCKYCYANAYII